MRAIDLSGQRFGRLTVIEQAPTLVKNRRWHCLCDCGNKIIAIGDNLKRGGCKSCGCLQSELQSARIVKSNFVHGHNTAAVQSLTWMSWISMKKRCENPKHVSYPAYGGRGIVVCERWQDFRNFLLDMGERPNKDMSIDRWPNKNGNYEPGNCRWATRSQQQRNRRDNRPGVV